MRPFLFAAAFAIASLLVPHSMDAHAEEKFPTQIVKIVVGFPAGSSADILARLYAQRLSEHFGEQFIVENRPGASGNIAAEAVARAPADGYTLYLAVLSNAIGASAFKDLRFSFEDDFAPVAAFASAPNILVVAPELGVSSISELIALAKARPGQIHYGSAGVGSAPHMAGELFNYMTGVKLVHVPYRGIPAALNDLLGHSIEAVFATAPTVAGHVKDGRVKALATTSATRSSLAPEVPTMAEAGLKGYDVAIWYGFVAPKGTPESIRRALAKVIVDANAEPQIQRQLASNGAEPFVLTLDKFGEFMQAEVKKWKPVVDYAGLSLK